MNAYKYRRQVLLLDDDELEEFVRQWTDKKSEYVGVERFEAPGDLGRDVVGFRTSHKHEGEWDNFQCKQYGKSISTEVGLRELGKILYNASEGHFPAPKRFFFVAPRGLNRNLRGYVSKPTELKAALINNWDQYCATKIVENKTIPLTGKVLDEVENWDYSNVYAIGIDKILGDAAAASVLYKWFKADPGPPPSGDVPAEHSAAETGYIGQLYMCYGEREQAKITSLADLAPFSKHEKHLELQRERFFAADAFTHFYRDNTDKTETDALRKDIYHGVIDTFNLPHADALARIDTVMIEASRTKPAGLLSKYARNPIKQGICHHFANDGEWSWSNK